MALKTRAVTVALGISLLAACSSSGMNSTGSNLMPASSDVSTVRTTSLASNTVLAPIVITPELQALANAAQPSAAKNVFKNPGFETGKLKPWVKCSSTKPITGGIVSTADPHSGKYDAFSGTSSTKAAEVNGLSGVCQVLTIPQNGYLSIWLRPVTNEPSSNSKVGQFVGIYSPTSGNNIATFYYKVSNSAKWIELKGSIAKYAGTKVLFATGVMGAGDAGKYIGLYVDDASLTSNT